jgi:DNA-binding NarL/FixJ family response regulator
MNSTRRTAAIQIGLVSDEPIRLEGLISIFEEGAHQGEPGLSPITGTIEELLAHPGLEYLLLDLHSSSQGLEILHSVRRCRPSMRLIVIGPEGNDEMVLESIVAGARGYIDLTADIDVVRQAIDGVTSGSIFAPRRLLSKLIDRLLRIPDSSLTNANPHLTSREHQVLDLILLACSNREIARQLGIEERTVKAHVGRLMRKTGTVNRTELSMRELNRPIKPSAATIGRRRDERRRAAEALRVGARG